MWTRQIAAVMNAVLDGGASVVGFDLISPTSVERHVRGFDREFLKALNRPVASVRWHSPRYNIS
jgi:adenylate cyclase/guanylate cyclase